MLDAKFDYFFDRKAVERAVGRAAKSVLSEAGRKVRATAQKSLKYAKDASKPGEPPHVHKPSKSQKSPLRDLLFYAFDPAARSVVIGPAPFKGTAIVPPVLEYGGAVKSRKNRRRRLRKIGDAGEIRVDAEAAARGSKTRRRRDGHVIVYAPLRTQAQADRANEINAALYGPATLPARQQAARPFMGPALKTTEATLGPGWRDQIKP